LAVGSCIPAAWPGCSHSAEITKQMTGAEWGGTTGGGDEELWSAVRALPAKQRAAVVLRFVNDLSHREIAGVLDSSEAAARQNLREGLSKLREEWA